MARSHGSRRRRRRPATAKNTFLVVVAGPNGAGKSTFVDTFLRPTWRRDLVARGISFCMLDFLKECQSSGYTVVLVFIGLESAELSRARVLERVEAGGHDVPDEKIESRFSRTFANLRRALTFVDDALLFDNSSSDQPFRFVAAFRRGNRRRQKGYEPGWAAFIV